MLGLIWGGFVHAAAGSGFTVLLLGDSLSAAYGIPRESSWPELLRARLAGRNGDITLVNASISGETSAGGLARLPELLRAHRPSLLLLELGANDGLRGLSLKQLETNLSTMVAAAHEAGASTLLFEMRIPSNYGARYTDGFNAVFHDLAEAHTDVHLQPFFLQAIALDETQFIEDGIHPNAGAQPALLETVWPQIEALLPTASAPP